MVDKAEYVWLASWGEDDWCRKLDKLDIVGENELSRRG